MFVGVRGGSLCSECGGMDRVWAYSDKVSEARVAPG